MMNYLQMLSLALQIIPQIQTAIAQIATGQATTLPSLKFAVGGKHFVLSGAQVQEVV